MQRNNRDLIDHQEGGRVSKGGTSMTSAWTRNMCSPALETNPTILRFEPAFRGVGRQQVRMIGLNGNRPSSQMQGLEHPGRLPFQLHPDRKRSCNLLIAI
jgi:hypothetical protein